jgi:hypothetical protein
VSEHSSASITSFIASSKGMQTFSINPDQSWHVFIIVDTCQFWHVVVVVDTCHSWYFWWSPTDILDRTAFAKMTVF